MAETKIETEQTNDIHTQWDESIETIVCDLGSRAQAYKIMHTKLARSSSKLYQWLMLGSILTGPLSGTISAIGSATSPDPMAVLPIVATFVSFLAGILVAIVKFGKYDEKTTAYKQAAAKLSSLEYNVRQQLALPRDRREHATNYLKWISKSSEDVFAAMPIIPSSTQQWYAEEASKQGLRAPDFVGNTISINTRFVNQLTSKNSPLPNHTNVIQESEPESSQQVQRANTIGVIPELELYGEAEMKYQLSRLFNL